MLYQRTDTGLQSKKTKQKKQHNFNSAEDYLHSTQDVLYIKISDSECIG